MNAPFLRPTGCPMGVDPVQWRRAVQARIEQHADALAVLIDALDQMDVDPDYEPTLGSPEAKAGNFEGWQFPHSIDQTHWADGQGGERELEDEHGGDVQDEPHDYVDEGNADFCAADEMTGANVMTHDKRDRVHAECDRLLAQANSQLLPAATILPFRVVQR
jgi:hypothetical protein